MKMELTLFDLITFVHPQGVQLLKIYSDVVFCDSMWNLSQGGEFMLTIVVVDNENKLRMAAIFDCDTHH